MAFRDDMLLWINGPCEDAPIVRYINHYEILARNRTPPPEPSRTERHNEECKDAKKIVFVLIPGGIPGGVAEPDPQEKPLHGWQCACHLCMHTLHKTMYGHEPTLPDSGARQHCQMPPLPPTKEEKEAAWWEEFKKEKKEERAALHKAREDRERDEEFKMRLQELEELKKTWRKRPSTEHQTEPWRARAII